MEKQKTQRSFLQICRELFLPGKLMYIGIILYALSLINVQNVLFFQVDDVYYQLYTANIEEPLSDKEVPQLLKMANSITRVR